MRTTFAVSAIFVALAGCTVGPDYHIPEQALVNQQVARQPLETVDGYTTQAQPLPQAWWKLYDDSGLDGLIRTALDRNTDLRVAAANLERSRANVYFAEEQGGFDGGVSGQQSRDQLSGEQYLIPDKIPVTNVSDLGINVTYEIDLFGTLKRGIEAARADSDAAVAARDVARVEVVSGVVRAYVENCGAGAELAVASRVVSEQQTRGELVSRMRALGRSDASETSRQETAIRQVEAVIPRYRSSRRVALYRLATLLAEPISGLPEPVSTCDRLPKLRTQTPVGDGVALLKRRPDVREAERKLAAATAQIGVSIGALYPKVILGASAGMTGATRYLGEGATERWSIGPMISWTFPANGARARIAAARAGQSEALARFDGAILNALKDVQTGLVSLRGNLDRMHSLEQARASAADSASKVDRLYAMGRATFLDDLDASRSLTDSELELTVSRVEVSLSQVELFKALGGGWEVDTEAPAGTTSR